jgi:phage-related protein
LQHADWPEGATKLQLFTKKQSSELSKSANIPISWTISYYNERVKREIFALPAGILAAYLRLLGLIQEFGAGLRMPHSRAMGEGLFELRPRGEEGIGRVFYCTHTRHTVVMLHSFVKKTQETPRRELQKARTRLKEVHDGQS